MDANFSTSNLDEQLTALYAQLHECNANAISKLNAILSSHGSVWQADNIQNSYVNLKFSTDGLEDSFTSFNSIELYYREHYYLGDADHQTNIEFMINVSSRGTFSIDNVNTSNYAYYSGIGQLMLNGEMKNELRDCLAAYVLESDVIRNDIYNTKYSIAKKKQEAADAKMREAAEKLFVEQKAMMANPDGGEYVVIFKYGYDDAAEEDHFNYRRKKVALFGAYAYDYEDARRKAIYLNRYAPTHNGCNGKYAAVKRSAVSIVD